MPDRYLARTPAPAHVAPPNPLVPAALVVAVPVIAVLIGWLLLDAIAIENSTGRAVSYGAVRTAITQVLEKDLAADRLQELLTELPDAPQKPPAKPKDEAASETKATTEDRADGSGNTGGDAKAQAEERARQAAESKRATARAAKLKLVAARLSGERGRLGDRLTSLALVSHPGLETSIPAGLTPDERRQKMAAVVRDRLEPARVRREVETWISDALDARARADVDNTIAAVAGKTPQQTAAGAVAAALSVDALTRSATAAVALAYNPFDTRPGEAAWAGDVSARLLWAVVALVFILSFAIVAVATARQIWIINSPQRTIFLVVTAAAALIAGFVVRNMFSPSAGGTPLHIAFQKYVEVFAVQGILDWADINNFLRGAGLVLIVAGSVATFWVEVSSAPQLNEQLRGFKALFNASAVFLLAGTFEVFAGFRWPIVFAGDDATRTALQAAASAFSAAIGAGFAVVLLATYIATTAALRQQAIARGVKAAEADAAFQTFGFSDVTSQQFMRFAQALAPLLPGVFQLVLA